MNFDRIYRAKASAFALLRDKSAAAKTLADRRTEKIESGPVWIKEGILTANHADSKASRIRGSGVVRVFGVFRGYKINLSSAYYPRISGKVQASARSLRGQSLLQDKLEKNGISPKTWCWPIFQIGKFEPAANQIDPAEIERNQSRKFLQFLENFSEVYPPGRRGKC